MKSKKIILLSVIALLSIVMGTMAIASSRKSGSSTASQSQSSNAAAAAAEKFLNDYINYDISTSDWLASVPITENFKKIYNEKARALDLAEMLLNNEIKDSQLSSADKALLKKYPGIEYDPLLAGAVYDIVTGHSSFKMISWNEKTGIMVLEDQVDPMYAVKGCSDSPNCVPKPIIIKVKLKLVKSNGKWLVDDIIDVD